MNRAGRGVGMFVEMNARNAPEHNFYLSNALNPEL